MNNPMLGCLEDPQDNNDLVASSYLIFKKLPKSINWFDYAIPVSNQGGQPACVGYSGANLKKGQEKIETDKILGIDGLALYQELKKIDGMPDQAGTYIRVLMKYLQQTGVKDSEGNAYKIGIYTRITNVDELRAAVLANGFAVIGVKVFDSFYHPENGVINFVAGQKQHGLHAILVGAYDDTVERFLHKNSWGVDWGIGGYAYLSYKYIEKAMDSGWTAVDVDNPTNLASSLFDISKLTKDLNIIRANGIK